jgi:hypothetical protein
LFGVSEILLCALKKTRGTVSGAVGRERPQKTFWAAGRRKSGVAPARFGVFSKAAFLLMVSFISLYFRRICLPQGAEAGEDEGAEHRFYLLHLSCLAA